MHTSYVFAIPIKEKSAENVRQAYLTGVFAHKGGSIAILSDNGREFKNSSLNEACNQLSTKRIISPQRQLKNLCATATVYSQKVIEPNYLFPLCLAVSQKKADLLSLTTVVYNTEMVKVK